MTTTSLRTTNLVLVAGVGRQSRRTDGSLRPFATIWAVRVGDDIYVRSARGPSNGWFRRAVSSGEGRLRGGGVERDVTFELSGGAVNADVGRAYHTRYDRYGASMVGTVVNPEPAETTLRLVPR